MRHQCARLHRFAVHRAPETVRDILFLDARMLVVFGELHQHSCQSIMLIDQQPTQVTSKEPFQEIKAQSPRKSPAAVPVCCWCTRSQFRIIDSPLCWLNPDLFGKLTPSLYNETFPTTDTNS